MTKILRQMSAWFVAPLMWCASLSAEAAPLYKCLIDGRTTFQQTPCPSTQPRQAPTVEALNAAEHKRRAAVAAANAQRAAPEAAPASPAPAAMPSPFRCDGRQHCSQMRSCEEAKFFLASCPGVKMDGDRNGIPCEQQWCSR